MLLFSTTKCCAVSEQSIMNHDNGFIIGTCKTLIKHTLKSSILQPKTTLKSKDWRSTSLVKRKQYVYFKICHFAHKP